MGTPSAAPSGWVPHYVAIVDIRPVIYHIQSIDALDVLSECIGLERLLNEVTWDGFYGRTSESLEFFYENQEEIEAYCKFCVDDLFGPIAGLEEFLSTEFLNQVSKEKRDAFREEGFTFAAWESATHAVIASTSGRRLQKSSVAAIRYWGVLQSLATDPGLDDYYQSRRSKRRPAPIVSASRPAGARRRSRY